MTIVALKMNSSKTLFGDEISSCVVQENPQIGVDFSSEIDRLAHMSSAEFEAGKKDFAKNLRLSMTALSKIVAARRSEIKAAAAAAAREEKERKAQAAREEKAAAKAAAAAAREEKERRAQAAREEKAAAKAAEKELLRERIAASLEAEQKYFVRGGKIFQRVLSNTGDEFEKEISNFTAQIISQDILDDGVESRVVYHIRAAHNRRVSEFTVPAAQFNTMSWVSENLHGAARVTEPGATAERRVAIAIRDLSGIFPERHIYTHIGWREVDGRQIYLHGGGAVDANGVVEGLDVEPDGKLRDLVLIEPTSPDMARSAIQAAINLADVAAMRISAPIIANAFVAPIMPTTFSMHLEGETGALKSSFAAVTQSFWGTVWDEKNLPNSWAQSPTVLERDLSSARDAMLVVDEFKPNAGDKGASRLYEKFDEIIRSKANGAPRSRARRDGSRRPDRLIRAAILSTGEDIPRGHSCIARTLILEARRGDVDRRRLTQAQKNAREGIYSMAMWQFVRWLATGDNRAMAQMTIQNAVASARDGHSGDGHLRTSDATAVLKAAWRVFLDFAVSVEAITETAAAHRLFEVERAIDDTADRQGAHLRSEDPLNKFVSILSGLFSSGAAHATTATDARPDDAGAWGWQSGPAGWAPRGPRIAWLDGDNLYLEPAATYAAAQEFARRQGDSIPFSEGVLWKRMAERGLLRSSEVIGDERRMRVRRVLSGKRTRVVHVGADIIRQASCGDADDATDAVAGVI